MRTIWRDGPGTVEEVRAALPPGRRGAYTTVQTVLNRLSERGLLTRTKQGNALRYAATIDEAGYLSQTLRRTLASASPEAQNAALATLLGDMGDDERIELERRERRIAGRRETP